MWPLRSMLYVPAHRRDWVGKAIRVSPDAVILDIEDSVPPDSKQVARDFLHEEIAELRAARITPFVRVNAIGEGAEIDVAAAMCAGLAGVKLPKAGAPEQIRELHDLLSYHEGRMGVARGSVSILPIPETTEGLYRMHELAKASPRVQSLCGAISGEVGGDIARAFGFRPTLGGMEQVYLASKTVLDSRAGGAPYPIAGIFGMDMNNMAVVEDAIRRAKEIGFSGVAVMHPLHVAIANRVMRPSTEEIAYFKGMLEAFKGAESKGLGAISYQGAMVDYAMLPVARQIVAEAERSI
ncbi:MAG: CoA ester lyase [Acetobacteraceae bacterium]|nr:CoA ester lyase [Acetobacteraceae bacterium]